jgi:hypothetical protein
MRLLTLPVIGGMLCLCLCVPSWGYSQSVNCADGSLPSLPAGTARVLNIQLVNEPSPPHPKVQHMAAIDRVYPWRVFQYSIATPPERFVGHGPVNPGFNDISGQFVGVPTIASAQRLACESLNRSTVAVYTAEKVNEEIARIDAKHDSKHTDDVEALKKVLYALEQRVKQLEKLSGITK